MAIIRLWSFTWETEARGLNIQPSKLRLDILWSSDFASLNKMCALYCQLQPPISKTSRASPQRGYQGHLSWEEKADHKRIPFPCAENPPSSLQKPLGIVSLWWWQGHLFLKLCPPLGFQEWQYKRNMKHWCVNCFAYLYPPRFFCHLVHVLLYIVNPRIEFGEEETEYDLTENLSHKERIVFPVI